MKKELLSNITSKLEANKIPVITIHLEISKEKDGTYSAYLEGNSTSKINFKTEEFGTLENDEDLTLFVNNLIECNL